ncbi:hypothetical protein AKJ16_DCAP04323 [Drosera capensis]
MAQRIFVAQAQNSFKQQANKHQNLDRIPVHHPVQPAQAQTLASHYKFNHPLEITSLATNVETLDFSRSIQRMNMHWALKQDTADSDAHRCLESYV